MSTKRDDGLKENSEVVKDGTKERQIIHFFFIRDKFVRTSNLEIGKKLRTF